MTTPMPEWDEIARQVWEINDLAEQEIKEAFALLDDLLTTAANTANAANGPDYAAGVRWLRSDVGRDDQDAAGAGVSILALATDVALRGAGSDSFDAHRALLLASYMLMYRVALRDAAQS